MYVRRENTEIALLVGIEGDSVDVECQGQQLANIEQFSFNYFIVFIVLLCCFPDKVIIRVKFIVIAFIVLRRVWP